MVAALCLVSNNDETSGRKVFSVEAAHARHFHQVHSWYQSACLAHDELVVERCVEHLSLRQDDSKKTRQAGCR